MDRSRWFAWALVATLMGGVVAANAYVITDLLVKDYEDQSREAPPEDPWYLRFAPAFMGVWAGAVLLVGGAVGFAWARFRRSGIRQKVLAPVEEEEGEPPLMPPGFLGDTRVRTKRAGAGQLIGYSVLAFALMVAALAVHYFGIATLQQTMGMAGRGIGSAIRFGQMIRFLGLPLWLVAGLVMGAAWGRWFPLGELEVIQERRESKIAAGYQFDRH